MAINRRTLALLCVLALCCAAFLPGCRKEPPQESTAPSVPLQPTTYTVELVGQGGTPMEKVGIYIYTDAQCKELVWFEKTDAQGRMSFTDVPLDTYVAVLDKVPEGYPVEASYPITGALTRIELEPALEQTGDLDGLDLKLGGVMADHTFTTPDGKEYTVSQILKEKKALVLNFWYVECAPCKAEFPFLQEAYTEYAQDLEVLALNLVNQDPKAVADFGKDNQLTMPLAVCEPQWQQALGLKAYPTTVVIDRFGIISLIHTGSVTDVQTFRNIFDFFTAEDYKPTVITALDQLPEAEKKEDAENVTLSVGTKEEPLEFGGVNSFQLTMKPGQEVYCNVYKVNGMYMSIDDPHATVIYNDKTYTASGGYLGTVVHTPDMRTPVTLIFGNNGDEIRTYTVWFSALKGTMDNPYSMGLGDFSISVGAGNDQGIYCTYKVKEDGVLTVECLDATDGVEYDYTLYNLDTYALRNYRSDMTVTEEGKQVVTIAASAGDTVRISAAAMPDSTGYYPPATFKFRSYMGDAEKKEDPGKTPILYAVTLTDEDRKPIPGAQLFMELQKEQITLTTNAEGIAQTQQLPGEYSVTLKLPEGYRSRATSFLLTESNPTLSVKLDRVVYEVATYSVSVVDGAGQPIQNCLVAVGNRFGYTDRNGSVSFSLEKGSYTADVLAPEGYYTQKISTPFGEAMSLKLQLEKQSAPEADPEAVPYTVTVVDNGGKPISGVLARFVAADGTAALGLSDVLGRVTANLKPGAYSVRLAFAQDGYWYDPNTAVLTETATSVHVRLTDRRTDKENVVSTYMGDMFVLTEGGTYADGMQKDVPNYFVFSPEKSGVYRFSTSNPGAVISYWGGNTSYIQDMTSATDYSPVTNFFTINVKEGNLGSVYVLAVTGVEACIVDVVRTGDAVLDETDIVPAIYEGQTPTKQNTPSGTLTYVDITAATDAVRAVKGADGRYHLNSADGPVLYMNLGTNAPYVSMYNMLGFLGYGGTSLSRTFYDGTGKATHREDYTACMMTYVECIDSKHGVYPLNDDLIYMIQNGGEFKGWWDSESGNYVFKDVAGFNPELGWMFACCYFK